MSEPCLICGKLTEKLHFQVNICYGCAAFYRRSANSHKKYKCRNGKMKCSTNGLCRLCRYNRCLQLDLKINKFCQKTNNFYEIMNYEPDKTNPWNMYDMFYQINDIFKKSIPSTSSSTPNFFNFFNETIFSMIAASLPKQKWIPFSIEKEATFKTASFINNFAINSAKLLSSFQNFQKLPNNEKLILHDRFWQMFIYLRNVYVVFEHYGYESEFKVLIDNFQYLDEKSAPKFLEVDLENEGSKTFVVPYEEKLDKFYVEFKKVKATSFEFTYICLIALWSFHCLPQISESTKEIADKIIENASIKLHEYYTKELRMPDYAGRQAKLYKIAIMIESNAECCGMHVGNTGWCSAYGKCNIFCCNCENGCRTGDKKKKIFKELVKTPKEEFDLIDKNKDGFISFEAALEYANSHLNEIDRGNITDLSQDRSWFTFMDSNGDDKAKLAYLQQTLIVQNVEARIAREIGQQIDEEKLNPELWQMYIKYLLTKDQLLAEAVYYRFRRLFINDRSLTSHFLNFRGKLSAEAKAAMEEMKYSTPYVFKVLPSAPVTIYNSPAARQLLPFRNSLMHYILTNASQNVLRKLYSSCKYFYFAKRKLLCYSLYIQKDLKLQHFRNSMSSNGEEPKFLDMNKLIIQNSMIVQHSENPNLFHSIFSKLEACSIRYLRITSQTFYVNEYDFLTTDGKIKKLVFHDVSIFDENGESIILEHFLYNLPRAMYIDASVKTRTTHETETLLFNWDKTRKIWVFRLLLDDTLMEILEPMKLFKFFERLDNKKSIHIVDFEKGNENIANYLHRLSPAARIYQQRYGKAAPKVLVSKIFENLL